MLCRQAIEQFVLHRIVSQRDVDRIGLRSRLRFQLLERASGFELKPLRYRLLLRRSRVATTLDEGVERQKGVEVFQNAANGHIRDWLHRPQKQKDALPN